MNIQLSITGSTDKTVRTLVILNGESAGELQMLREDFTKLTELLFKGRYMISPSTDQKQ